MGTFTVHSSPRILGTFLLRTRQRTAPDGTLGVLTRPSASKRTASWSRDYHRHPRATDACLTMCTYSTGFRRIPPDNGHPGAPGGVVRTMPQSSIPYDVCDGCIPKTLECGAEEAPRHKREQDSILTANYGGVSTGLLPRTPAADASRSARLWSEASSNFNLKSEAKVAASCSSCPFLDFPCPPNAADCFAEHE
jgi:hypothetical protein